MIRQYFRIELVQLTEMPDNFLELVRQSAAGSIIRLTYFTIPLDKRCNLTHFLSRGIFPLFDKLIVVVDQISEIFEKLWNYDVMATGLAWVDVFKSFSALILLVYLKLKLYMSSDLRTVFLHNQLGCELKSFQSNVLACLE